MKQAAAPVAHDVRSTLSGASRFDALSFRELGKLFHTIADFFACQPQLI
jgi:hypothetical protein